MDKKPGTLGVTYEVREDPQRRGRWIVLRGGKPSGGFGNDMNMAINGPSEKLSRKPAPQTSR